MSLEIQGTSEKSNKNDAESQNVIHNGGDDDNVFK